jgi:hypothetical protein
MLNPSFFNPHRIDGYIAGLIRVKCGVIGREEKERDFQKQHQEEDCSQVAAVF